MVPIWYYHHAGVLTLRSCSGLSVPLVAALGLASSHRLHQAENPVLSALVEMVSSMFQQARQRTIRWATDLQQAAAEHRAIYQAIRAHDPEGARRAMADHLRRADAAQTNEPSYPPDDATQG